MSEATLDLADEHARVPIASSVRGLTVIDAAVAAPLLNLAELWAYRDLVLLLVWRDIAGRYRQSVIGYGWAFLKPALSIAIYTVIFGRVAGLPSDDLPYAPFVFAGLIPWMYFANALGVASTSVTSNAHTLTKVYFPRLVFPLVGVLSALAELLIQMAMMGPLLLAYGIIPGWPLLLAPLWLLLLVCCALGFGLWLTALNVKYRDVGMAVPFLLQCWMWLCPIVYSGSLVPDAWKTCYGLNPMVAVVEGWRWSLLGKPAPAIGVVMSGVLLTAMVLASGLYHFGKVEQSFADDI